MEDKAIVELYWQRDPRAIEETRQIYGSRLAGLALRVLGDDRDAEECVNDTLFRAWRVIPPQRPRFLGAFLAKIVRETAIDRLRARDADKRGGGEYLLSLEELSECVGGADAAFDEGALVEAIGAFLRTQRTETRWMFLRRYFELESIREIAQATGFSPSKVKSTLARTRKGLRKHLEKEGFDL